MTHPVGTRLLGVALFVVAVASAPLLGAAPARGTPVADEPACEVRTFVIGGASTCAPGAGNTQQLKLTCWLNNFQTSPNIAWGPEVPWFLPSVALCPPVIGFNVVAGGIVITR